MKDSFVFHFDWVTDLPEEFRDLFTLRAVTYAMTGEEPEVAGLEKTVWLKIKRQVDDDTERYEAKIEKRREAGRKGGRPKKSEETMAEAHQEQSAEPLQEVDATVTEGKADALSMEKTAVYEALASQGLIYEAEDIARMVDRVPLDGTADYIAFVCDKVRTMYAGKAPDEIRLIIRSALQSWANLRGEWEAHLRSEEEKRAFSAETPQSERLPCPASCPDCGGAMDFVTYPDSPRCENGCGFFAWESTAWKWNRKQAITLARNPGELRERRQELDAKETEEEAGSVDVLADDEYIMF